MAGRSEALPLPRTEQVSLTPLHVGVTATLVAFASLLARIIAGNTLPPPFHLYGYTDLFAVFFLGPVLELHWPYFLFPFEYHPLLGWGSALLSLVTKDVLTLTLAWGLIVAAASGAVGVLLARLATPRRALVFWALSPQLILFGGQNFDALAVLAVVAAVAAARAHREGLAAGALALGAATKLFPVAALPLLIAHVARVVSWRRALVAVGAAAAVFLIVDGPAIVAPYSLLAHGHSPYHRASWNLDSIWLPLGIFATSVIDGVTYDRFVAIVSAIGLAGSYLWLCALPALRGRPLAPLMLTAVTLILLWSRLYSPQYSLWLLPAFALCVPRPGLLWFLALGDFVTFMSFYPISFGIVPPAERATSLWVALLLSGVLVRHASVALLLRGLLQSRTRT